MVEKGTSHEVDQVILRTFVQTVEFDGEVSLVTGTYEVKDNVDEELARHNAYSYSVYQTAEGVLQLTGQRVRVQSEKFGEYRVYEDGVIFTREELEGYSLDAKKRNGSQDLLHWMKSMHLDRVIKTPDDRFHGFGPNDRVLRSEVQVS